jgi:hypothetical protein
MPIKQTTDHLKREHFMLSDYPPWQLYRWTYDTAKPLNVIERFDAEKAAWVIHDNDLLRGAFMDQQDAALTPIPAVRSIEEAAAITAEGWTPALKKKIEAAGSLDF